MRRPDLDIKLSNGQGFMAEEKRYMEYLKVVREPTFVSRVTDQASVIRLTFFCLEAFMSEPSSCQCSQLQQSTEPRRHWSGGLLLRKARVFYPNISL